MYGEGLGPCSELLRRQGRGYPRTCEVCGLGPCRRKASGPTPSPWATAPAAISAALHAGEAGGSAEQRWREPLAIQVRSIAELLAVVDIKLENLLIDLRRPR